VLHPGINAAKSQEALRERRHAVARDDGERQIFELERKINAIKDRLYTARWAGKPHIDIRQLCTKLLVLENELQLAVYCANVCC